MARFNDLTFPISDPGVTGSASQRYNGGPATYIMDLSAAASSTVIALQYSPDDSNWVAVNDVNGTAASTSTSAAADDFYTCVIPEGYVRIKASAGAGATTTGTAYVISAKDRTDG